MTRRHLTGFGLLVVLVLAAIEWLAHPVLPWALIVVASGFTGGILLGHRPGRSRPLMALMFILALAIPIQQFRISRIQHAWPAVRDHMVDRAFRSLSGELARARTTLENAVTQAARANDLDREAAFAALERAVPSSPELGVAILDSTGRPYAWAGPFRLPPDLRGESLESRADRFLRVLVARRALARGRTAVASMLLWADSVVPGSLPTLVGDFRHRTGVELEFYPAGASPAGQEVFSYEVPTTAGPRVIFSARPVPPDQGEVLEGVLRRGGALTSLLVLLVLLLAVLAVPYPPVRLGLLILVPWLFIWAPAGEYLGAAIVFSPGTYFRELLGPLSRSAGVLALSGAVVTTAGIWLWRLRFRTTRLLWVAGVLLLLSAPYAMRELGRGITPPASGVSLSLWLCWQLALLLATAAPIVIAAGLFRGTVPVHRTSPWIWLGAASAVVAAVAGIYVWGPAIGWPPWYTLLWTPALFLVTRPAPRLATITAIATVAGCAAALLTWGAVIEGRLDVARTDVGGLGSETDPLAIRLLELVGDSARAAPEPQSAADLFLLWRSSSLAHEGYPAQLATWTADGTPVTELRLDSLDVSPALLSTLVRNLDSTSQTQLLQVVRSPGVHSILVERLEDQGVLTVVVGPRTRLITPARLGRLLRPRVDQLPLYDLSLTLPSAESNVDSVRLRWNREGWQVIGHRQLSLPDGIRHLHAVVDLRGPAPILVRGALVVLLDIAVLMLLWVVAEALAGRRLPVWSWQRIRRSYQARLALTLGAFFLLPTIGFAAWGFLRLRDEGERTQDLLIAQSLRDAVLAAGALGLEPDRGTEESLMLLGRRVDAEFALYSGGELVAASTPLLPRLALMPELMPAPAFRRLGLDDQLQLTTDSPSGLPGLVTGYRVLRPGPPQAMDILATPQPAADPELAEQQADLVLVLLLATLIGVGGALLGAHRAARALSRPVEDLRRSALALGGGLPVLPPADQPPAEFEEVFGAFARMASDVRQSQALLEEARRRTAAVLASVATGVVALGAGGEILIANRRAEEILGVTLTPGARLADLLPGAWRPLMDAVASGRVSGMQSDGRELDVEGRRIGVQLTRADSDLSALVVALNDLTDISRAERVLAWGEMAQQVAHEIKNPLTPLRLGIQHLRRVHRDRSPDFHETLERTAERILLEIDRLDTIARAFSRFGAPAAAVTPLEPVDLSAAAAEVVQLYRLGDDGTSVSLEAEPGCTALARTDEVKEVLGNLIENARAAGAGGVIVRVSPGRILVRDNGPGMPPDRLARIFEPRFSTTSSGSGLGLPIVRRLVESWGASVEVTSEVGQGTTVAIQFPAPAPGS